MRTKLWAVAAFTLLFAACDRDSITGPREIALDESRAGPPALNVMTYNVYWGARFEELLLIQDPSTIPFKVAELFAAVQATDFQARADAIVDQIEGARPHVIALQEMALYRIQSPGDFLQGNPLPATTPVLDFLQILGDELLSRGLNYSVVATSDNFDVELPIVNFETGGLDDIRLTESLVTLVRDDIDWSDAQSGTFAAAVPIDLGGVTIIKPSGWTAVDLMVKGLPYRFVNTHLEPADIAPGAVDPGLAQVQAAQVAELLTTVDAAPMPVIMAGDFNTDPDGSTTATYQTVVDAGFVDTWLIGPPRGPGYTSNQAPDLLNAASQLFHRIDYVFYRDAFTARTGQLQGTVHAAVVGDEQADRTASGLWPSDHAGLSVSLRIAPGRGHTD